MAAHQAPPSLGFSRQEHWSGLPFPSPMHESEKWNWSGSVVSDSSRPHGLQPTEEASKNKRMLTMYDIDAQLHCCKFLSFFCEIPFIYLLKLSLSFLMWVILKVFIGFVTILFLLYVLAFWPQGIWNFGSSLTRDWTHTLCFYGKLLTMDHQGIPYEIPFRPYLDFILNISWKG